MYAFLAEYSQGIKFVFIDLELIAKWSNVLKIMISCYSQTDYRIAWEGRMLIPTHPFKIVCLTEGKDILIHT